MIRVVSALLGAAGAVSIFLGAYASAQTVTRGPYLQQTTDQSVILRWRTDVATDSEVRYGASPSTLTSAASSPTATTEHEVLVGSLSPDTRYYYSVGDSGGALAGGDGGHHFTTSPVPGTATPTRIWVLGDSGTADANARAVRDAFAAWSGGADPDLWLMLGDNAYPDGTDSEYQAAVFDIYPETLKRVALWPTLGNHDGHTADSATQSGAYYDIFSLPRAGEAGGLASGTEAYYSFDYGDIHFISLESYETDRSASGAMMTWLENDLAANDRSWTIAFWHHPPYTKGSHNSDTEGNLVDMRQVALPILEAYGVDLVLGGHSHSYERSYFLDGHYGSSSTLTPAMVLDGTAGNDADAGPYEKDMGSVNSGAVYAVAGSSGKISGGALNHPAMYASLNLLGSMAIDIDGERLDAVFIDNGGTVRDAFSIVKGADLTPPIINGAVAADADQVVVTFSEPVDPAGAETPSNYSLDNGATVTGAALETDGASVLLTTTLLTEGATYTLGVANVTDLAGNPIAPGASTTFTYEVLRTLSFQDGVAPDAVYAGTADATLSQNAPTTNYGASGSLLADGDDPGGTGDDLSALMAWDVSAIPPTATVEGATITINVTNISSGPYELFELLVPWQEASATWSQRAAGQPWGAPGASGAGDRGAAVLGSASAGVTGPHSIALNAAGLAVVQGWIDGGGVNNGMILANPSVNDGLDFSSSEDPDPVDRPKLTVTYTLPPGGGDAEPPLAPTGLAATGTTESSVTLAWTPCAVHPAPCDNVGVTGYSVYRDGALVGAPAAPGFTDGGLSPATAYDYEVTSHDAAGNVSPSSGVVTATTDPPPALSVKVNDIVMALRPVGKKKQAAIATVAIVDGDAAPAAGASVTAAWSGVVGGSVSGVTGADGIVTFESGRVDNTATGQFVLTVTGVTLAGHDYDPAANVETSDCIDTDGLQCGGGPGNLPPVADFSAPAFCDIGAACAFADLSTDADGTIASWSWDFGDGAGSSAQNPSHSYACPAGLYAVTLTVTDDGGASDARTRNVTVTGDCGGAPVSLSEVASTNNGGTWTATVRITVSGPDAAVGGAWSGGAAGAAGCTTVGGVCEITSPAIRKRDGSVTYTATTLAGALLSPEVSITVLKP